MTRWLMRCLNVAERALQRIECGAQWLRLAHSGSAGDMRGA